MTRSPSRQARANAAGLSAYLQEETGKKVWIEPRVVWAGPGKLYIEGKPATYIWYLDRMKTYTDDLVKMPARPKQVQEVRRILQQVVQAGDKK